MPLKKVFIFPLSFPQRRYWTLEQLQPGTAFFHVPWGAHIYGVVDRAILERVLNTIVGRHESLRTRFTVMDGEPQQVVDIELQVPLRFVDVSSLTEVERLSTITAHIEQNKTTLFDLRAGPLIRATLIRIANEDNLLLMAMHHIVFDGWSMSVFVREAGVLYEAFSQAKPSPLPELHIQYGDYAVWQTERMKSDSVMHRKLAYWKEHLQGIRMVEIPADYPRSGDFFRSSGLIEFSLSEGLTSGVRELGNRGAATLFIVLLAGWQVLLHRILNQADISVGVTIAGRTRPETEEIIGCFFNTLIIRTHFAGTLTFSDALQRVKKVVLEAYENQDVPIEAIADEVQPDRDRQRPPLYNIGFAMNNTPPLQFELKGAKADFLGFDIPIARADLSLSLTETEKIIYGKVRYGADAFARDTIQRLMDSYISILQSAVNTPDSTVAELKL